jgi:SAM-dependent methyltransferase
MEPGEVVDREHQYWDSVREFSWLTHPSIDSILSNCPPFEGDVLELCSGIGMFTAAIPKSFSSYTCLDLSATRLASLRRALADDVNLVQGDAQYLAFASNSFDYICVFAGLHHLPSYQATLRESYRVLRPNGYFVCFEPNAKCWYRRLANPIRRCTGLFTEDEVFIKPFELARRLARAGFDRVESQYMTPRYNADFLGNPLNRLLALLVYAASSVAGNDNWQAFVLMTARKPLH